MFPPANQPRFTLTLDSGPNELKVLEFKGRKPSASPIALTWNWSASGLTWRWKSSCIARHF